MTHKYIFIDRDGVINKDPGGWTKYSYVTNRGEFHFLPGALEALAKLHRFGYKAIIISNQAGVGKGHFTKRRLDEVNEWMTAEVASNGGRIVESFYCIHKKEDNCPCRKPKAGLLRMAAKKYFIDPAQTYFIGDSEVDFEAGARIGTTTIGVLSGKMTADELKKCKTQPDYVFTDLLAAVEWVLGKEKRRSERAMRRDGAKKRRKAR